MELPDYRDKKFQAILTKELALAPGSSFTSRDALAGTQLFGHAIGIVRDGDRSFVLIGGSFESAADYVVVKTDLPDDFRFDLVARDLESHGINPWKARLVCVAVDRSEAGRGPEKKGKGLPVHLVFVPF